MNTNDVTPYDEANRKTLFDNHMLKKYSNTDRNKVIWKKLGYQIFRAFQTNFGFNHRFKKIRKMSLE